MQLRYLQSLIELSSDRTSTVVFPVPIDTIEHFLRRFTSRTADSTHDEDELAAEH
jgi:hypothetical protein